MTKEYLEALKFIFDEALFSEFKNETHTKVRECHSVVYEALKRLEAIDNTNPSEALEILLKAKQERLIFYGRLLDNDKIFFETLEPALLKLQEQEKALSIIFEKNVNMPDLEVAIHNNSLRLYNGSIPDKFKYLRLTKEEFELLKKYRNI